MSRIRKHIRTTKYDRATRKRLTGFQLASLNACIRGGYMSHGLWSRTPPLPALANRDKHDDRWCGA